MSKYIGLVFLTLSVGLVMWRIRYYLQTASRWTGLNCPMCGNSLQRNQRRPLEYLISWWLPVRRYQCNYPECRWGGLRVKPLSSNEGENRE